MKKALSLLLALVLCLSLCACGSDVKPVMEQIEALNGNITLDSGPFIEKAEAAYNALTDAEKEKVTNYAILVSARSQFDELFKNVAATIALIEALPKQEDIQGSDGFDILDAWKAYNALTEQERTKVTNLDKLETAIETVNKIPIDAIESFFTYEVEVTDYLSGSVSKYTQCAFRLTVAPAQEYMRFENVRFKVTIKSMVFSGSKTIELEVSDSGYGYTETDTFLKNGIVLTKDQVVTFSSIESADVVSGIMYFNIGN